MLTLYIKSGCPYCIKVLNFTKEHNIDLIEKDAYAGEQNMKELLEKGGKNQAPFLVDDTKGVSMYESDDIISYFKKKYDNV
ncbi:glutathione S-transferase N-terminal domain-containing protein [Patescibacteria group bacterium AH-259-L05]|nr:glutathione S-transferase N-terminal domain-containing protein [Patescibacteria group bacterium AH-259-L05]